MEAHVAVMIQNLHVTVQVTIAREFPPNLDLRVEASALGPSPHPGSNLPDKKSRSSIMPHRHGRSILPDSIIYRLIDLLIEAHGRC